MKYSFTAQRLKKATGFCWYGVRWPDSQPRANTASNALPEPGYDNA
jgi:hypothetical protein